MGKIKYDFEELFRKSPVVDSRSIKIKVRKKQYSKQLLRNLVLKGKIKRIAKGFYTSSENISVAVFCFKPSYLGLQDALSFHNLWEQETIPVIITARKVRQGIRDIQGNNVLLRRMDKKYMFGFEYYNDGDVYLPYSDIEKTLIDMVYFKERLDKETMKNIKKKIDIKKLNSYLKVYPKRFRNRAVHLLL